jgi:hypothetical protein
VAKKKLVITKDGQPVHRVCPPVQAERQKSKPKEMSRTVLLQRIEELRAADATMPQAGKELLERVMKKKPQAVKKKPVAKGQPRPQLKAEAQSTRATRPGVAPQPYYGVEMKSRGGRWVQMHPESE